MRVYIRWALLALLCLAAGAGVFALRVRSYATGAREVGSVLVEVPTGVTRAALLELIGSSGLGDWRLGNELALRYFGDYRAVKAGVYRFTGAVSLRRVFDDFAHGRVDLVTVTLPEGLTAREIGALLGASGVTDGARFTALALSADAAKRWNLPGPTLEGFLFPDTYKFARKLPPEAVVDALVGRFCKVAAEVSPDYRAGGLDLLGWVTLASIVEKETGSAPERPLVASVFANRLKIGMLLQTDPTVIYGIPQFDGNIRRADLRRDTPYNTYTRKGLPPGPIANPGRASLEAARSPARTPYLYFVARNDGTHHFSRTLAEHEAAVKKYQLGKR